MAALQHEELEHLGGAGRYGEMQGGAGRCRDEELEHLGGAARYREVQGGAGRYREMQGDTGVYRGT